MIGDSGGCEEGDPLEHSKTEMKRMSFWMKRRKGDIRAFVHGMIFVEPNATRRLAGNASLTVSPRFCGYPMFLASSNDEVLQMAGRPPAQNDRVGAATPISIRAAPRRVAIHVLLTLFRSDVVEPCVHRFMTDFILPDQLLAGPHEAAVRKKVRLGTWHLSSAETDGIMNRVRQILAEED